MSGNRHTYGASQPHHFFFPRRIGPFRALSVAPRAGRGAFGFDAGGAGG
jgi:hypothetical protein